MSGHNTAHRSHGAEGWLALRGGISLEVLTDNVVVDDTYGNLIAFDPGGSERDVTLPAIATRDDVPYLIFNAADAAENLTVLDALGATVLVISQGEVGVIAAIDGAWVVLACLAGGGGALFGVLTGSLVGNATSASSQVAGAPFSRETWTHAVFTLEKINDKSAKPTGRLWLNGRLQGSIENWDLTFDWKADAAQLVLGAAYVGHLDDLAVFDRALTDAEVKQLMALKNGVRYLRP